MDKWKHASNLSSAYKKCFDIKCDPHIALLHIRITPLGLGLPSLAPMSFNYPIRGILPKTANWYK